MTTASTLAEHAFDIVVRDLEGFGNRLNDQHRQALRRMLEIYSSMACGEIAGRFAFDLPTGCGKTQSLIAWCQAVHEIKSGHSAVIATSKVEELCNIKRKLIEKGVPEECVGLVHSKLCDQERVREWLLTRDPSALKEMGGNGAIEYASLPRTTENERRQFLLVTHSRVQNRQTNHDLLNTFRGDRRNLLFWDESLLVSRGQGITKREIDSALAWLDSWVTKHDGALNEALVYLRDCATRLSEELDAQKWRRPCPRLIELPGLSAFEADLYNRALRKRPETKPLASLLCLRQRYLRVIPVNQGGGAIVT